MAGWQDAPAVGGAPPPPQGGVSSWQSAPVVQGVGGVRPQIDVYDAFQRQTKTGQYAPPPQPTRVEGNPQASGLPGPFGQAMNTFNSASHGAMDAATANLGDELYAGVSAPIRAGIDAMQGRGFDLGRSFNESLGRGEETARNLRDLNPSAYDTGGVVGSLGLMGRGGSPVGAMGPMTKGIVGRTALQSGGVGAAMGLGEPGTIQERLTNAAVGGGAGAIVGGVGGKLVSQFAKGAPGAAPTVKQLFEQGDAAFKAARASGAALSPQSAKSVIGELRAELIADGAITPSGKIAGLPKIEHALNLADDYATSSVTIEQLLRIRKQLAKAAASIDKDERTLGMALVRKLDDTVLKLKPTDFAAGANAAPKAIQDWKVGREIWHTAKKAESIEGLTAAARRQHQKSAAVPMEQATRNKFGNFAEKEKNLRGFSAKERQAIQAVADGSKFANTAKQIGRLAPTTMGSLGLKAGAPFAIGMAAGGGNPLVGSAVAAGSLGLGYVGKAIASLSTANRAKLAQILIRNGGQMPTRIPGTLPKALQRALTSINAAAGANAGNLSVGLAEALQSGGRGSR